ncbi:MAG: Mth938-like domain-containing protein [Rhodospirillales bacterium]|nr:Mth938-like domain-containing protein [Rhodospirillales bacterium]
MSGLDITPRVPPGRKVVQAYGDGRFRISGESVTGSVVVWPDGWTAWPVADVTTLSADDLAPIRALAGTVDILLIGCGARFGPEPAGLRVAVKNVGMALEWMDTGAACRTYNVLVGEGRRIAAALIAV